MLFNKKIHGVGSSAVISACATLLVSAMVAGSPAASAATKQVVNYTDSKNAPVHIEVVADGEGPLVLMLPSLGRDSDDYGPVAQALVRRGYRVLLPAPRGIEGSTGPLTGISLHDLAGDIAEVIRQDRHGPAVIIGHAFGNWVARTAATDHPDLVRGVVIAAAASKQYAPELSGYIDKCEDYSLPDEERLRYLRMTFFAPKSDPKPWLKGWHADAKKSQRAARAAIRTEEFWGGGKVPMLDLMAAEDPFRLPATKDENRLEFGDRVTAVVIPDASHALIPEQPALVAEAVSSWIRASVDK